MVDWTAKIRVTPHFDVYNGKTIFRNRCGYVSVIGDWGYIGGGENE